MNKNHEEGRSKAIFLKKVLGYNEGDRAKFHEAISDAINGRTPDKAIKTEHGVKCTFNTKIKGNNGCYHQANVIVVIQNDNGKTTWRLITLFPGKRDK